jgi:hypothetical protein
MREGGDDVRSGEEKNSGVDGKMNHENIPMA